jgi:hypothetical protein
MICAASTYGGASTKVLVLRPRTPALSMSLATGPPPRGDGCVPDGKRCAKSIWHSLFGATHDAAAAYVAESSAVPSNVCARILTSLSLAGIQTPWVVTRFSALESVEMVERGQPFFPTVFHRFHRFHRFRIFPSLAALEGTSLFRNRLPIATPPAKRMRGQAPPRCQRRPARESLPLPQVAGCCQAVPHVASRCRFGTSEHGHPACAVVREVHVQKWID